MTPLAAFTLMLVGEPAVPVIRIQSAQVTIRRQVIVRVPTRAATTRIEWKDRKGPKCTPMESIAGAAVTERDSVDLILRTGDRLRTEFRASCPALDFYSGFYILPTGDRRICADRDAIHARSGGECEIARFRKLMPVAVPPPPPAALETVSERRRSKR